MEPRNQVTMTADPAGVGQAQGRASEHAGVPRVRGSFSSIHHINGRKTAVIQFAPSKSPRLFNSSGPITGTQRWRLSPLTSTALAQASAVGSGMNQGVGCAAAQKASEWSQNLGGLTVWHWPAWSRVPLQRCCWGMLIPDQSAQTNDLLEPNADEPLPGKTKLLEATGHSLTGLVCRFCLRVLLCDPC